MLIEDLLATEGYLIYVILFLALMGGALGLPIPEDLPLIAAGIFAARGDASILGLFLTCYIGVVVGDFIIFAMGRWFGAALFSKPWFKRRLSPRRLKRFKINLERRSLITIFVARHLFYLRMATFLACGAVKMRYTRFIIADAIAALVSVPLMMTVGYFAADYHEEILDNLEWIFLGLAIIAIGYFLLTRRTKKGEKKKEDKRDSVEPKNGNGSHNGIDQSKGDETSPEQSSSSSI